MCIVLHLNFLRLKGVICVFLLLSILYTMFAVSPILGQDRYRLPLHGIIWIYVGYALIDIHSLWKAKRDLAVRSRAILTDKR